MNESERLVTERKRIVEEYRRRETEIASDLYAPWQPWAAFMAENRKRIAALMLHQAGAFPHADDECLEIGYGTMGWLGDLITWGVKEHHIHGVELDGRRAQRAQEVLPVADLRVGDGTSLPWKAEVFRLVIASTLFTSVLDEDVRRMLAKEITRVLAPGGALLWYDFRFNNPSNPNVRKVSSGELRSLFSGLQGKVRSITLAPPFARVIVPWSRPLATVLESVPLFRTHLISVLRKEEGSG